MSDSDKEIDDILKEIKENKNKLTQNDINKTEFKLEVSDDNKIENDISQQAKRLDIQENTVDETVDKEDVKPEQETSYNAQNEGAHTEDDDVHFDITESQQDDINSDDSQDNDDEDDSGSAEELADDKDEYFSEYTEEEMDDDVPNGKKKKIIIAVVAVIAVIAVALGVYFGMFYNKSAEPETTTESTTAQQTTEPVAKIVNPLTGEEGYDETALTQRPVAVVVENEYSTAAVKPQWGISQADIVLEGESEFSTRMLMFWADYNKVPDQVGPTRSARPPFIRFSQLFDAVFIHAGLSHTAGGYVGADTVFENENIDHINLLSLSESGDYFGRDYSRTKVVEHTGYLKGKNVAKLLEERKIDTTLNQDKFTSLSFNDYSKKLSDIPAVQVNFVWSSRCPKNALFIYDSAKGKYTTTDFDSKFGKSDVEFENVILLLDKTEYVVKQNYKGPGNSETYCNYELSGGKGLICSNGTALEILWGVTDGKLWMRDESGNDISLNPGKSYIGYGSSNNGGSYFLANDVLSSTKTKN